jgi:protein ImuB
MPLADARARYPALPAAEADPQADFRLLETIADWCDRYTPLVGLDPPDGLKLDISGCAHLFGGEAALARDLVDRLGRQGFRTRVAVADTLGCAWAIARYGDVGTLIHGESIERAACVSIVPPGKVETAMRPLPVAALRSDSETVAALAAAGLCSIADLADRPRAPLAARFGEELMRRLDRAFGRIDEPMTPRLPLPAAFAERRFAEPIVHETCVLDTIERLARQLAQVLERRGEGIRLVQLALFRADGVVHRLEFGTGAPLREPVRVRRLFEDRLAALDDACDPGFGFDMVRLAALVTERCDPLQIGLAGGNAANRAEELAHLIDRLGARFGLRRITRLVPQDTHIPEFAVAAVPAHAARSTIDTPSPSSRLRGEAETPEQDSLAPSRPIRLLERPEPIEAVAEVPDGPPVRFRWRRVLHEVAHAEGPERIAMEWWRDAEGRTLTRDYFRVESKLGARVWLYREGLYGRETDRPRWYLHGLFA